MSTIRGLSLRQPWGWAVVHGLKTVENRKWKANYRGEFLVHAAKGLTREEYLAAIRWMLMREIITPTGPVVPRFEEIERGGFIGRATLVSVVPPHGDTPCTSLVNLRDRQSHMHEQYGFVLSDAKPVPFVPYSGALNFFNVPDTILARIP